MKRLAIVFFELVLIETGWSYVGPDVLASLKGANINEIRLIHDRALLAAQEGNRVAETIAYSAKRVLGQDRTFNRIQCAFPRPYEEAERAETEKDWITVVDKKAADGEAFFMVIAGVLCYYGYAEVPVDRQKALVWFTKASELNCGLAKLNMGNCYMNGELLPRDLQKAALYFREAGELGIPAGWNNLGCLYNDGWKDWPSRDIKKAMEYWEKSAALNHAKSQYNLAFHYCNGDEDFPVNKELGIKWMKAAATNGHPDAKWYLAKYVDKKRVQRTLPAVIEDKSTDVVTTVIAFDNIKESIAGTQVAVVCFVDAYDPLTFNPSQDKGTPSNMLDFCLAGIRTFRKQQTTSAESANADNVKIFIIEGWDDTRAKVREFDKQCQTKIYDGTIPVLYVFNYEKLITTYTYKQYPKLIGQSMKSVVENLLTKNSSSFKPQN